MSVTTPGNSTIESPRIPRRAKRAEAARERGLMLARRGEFEAALRDFRHSLELTKHDWEHRDRVLADIGKLSSREAKVILGAAVIDDVLGLVILAVVSGIAVYNIQVMDFVKLML